jgi:hypothetical protein
MSGYVGEFILHILRANKYLLNDQEVQILFWVLGRESDKQGKGSAYPQGSDILGLSKNQTSTAKV